MTVASRPPLIIICVPIRPEGTVRWKWARHLYATFPMQGPAGARVELVYRDEGEPIVEAYERMTELALQSGAEFIWFLEDDIFPPPGAAARLVEVLRRPENADVGGVGGVYWWRAGYMPDFPLIIPRDGAGPLLDWTPGDLLEVEAAGQGCFMVRTSALLGSSKPWWSMDYYRAEEGPNAHPITKAADHYFFHRLREEGWRLLVDTRVCCEHQDITTGIVYPRDPAVRARYARQPGSEFGLELDSELLRASRRHLERQGIPYIDTFSGRTAPDGGEPALPEAPRFDGHYADDVLTPDERRALDVAPAAGQVEVANIGWGGVPIRRDIAERLPALLGVDAAQLTETTVEWAAARAALERDLPAVAAATLCWVADHHLAELKDNHFGAVYLHHVLEHVRPQDAVDFLAACYRILRPGGVLFVAVPDARKAAELVMQGKLEHPMLENSDGSVTTAEQMLHGAQRYPGDAHLASYTFDRLRQRCYQAGIPAEELQLSLEQTTLSICAVITKGTSARPRPKPRVERVYQRPAGPARPDLAPVSDNGAPPSRGSAD